MNTPTTNNILKVVKITDLGINMVSIPNGVWLVDGEVVTNQGYTPREVSCSFPDNIKRILTTKVFKHWVDQDGEIVAEDAYREQHEALALKSSYSDEDGYVFENLEDEFAYRKFKKNHKAVYEDVTEHVDCTVDYSYIVQDTGNLFITSGYLVGDADPLFTYNKTGAVKAILHNKMKELGMEFVDNLSYSATAGKKVWSNSTHLGLQYVCAFGTYFMPKQMLPQTYGVRKGSLEAMKAMYEADKLWVEDLVVTCYNKHFGNKCASGLLLADLHDKLLVLKRNANTLDVKVNSDTTKNQMIRSIDDAFKMVTEELNAE